MEYHTFEKKRKVNKINKSNKNDVIKVLGQPSTKGMTNDNVMDIYREN